MDLPVLPPVPPMLSKGIASFDALPAGADLVFEPKWDGFRCIVFRDGDEVVEERFGCDADLERALRRTRGIGAPGEAYRWHAVDDRIERNARARDMKPPSGGAKGSVD